MTGLFKFDLKAATRLTQQGRLDEAVATIMAALQRKKARAMPETLKAAPQEEVVEPEAEPAPGTATVQEHLQETLEDLRAPAVTPWRRPAFPGSFTEQAFSNDAGTRHFKLYVPAGRTDGSLPFVVMLHGCTQSPDDFAAGTRMNELAEEIGFLVAYPAQPKSANPSKCWNWFNPIDQQRDRGETSLIAGITRKVMREHDVDPGKVFIAGLSAGGAAAVVMAEAYPDLYRAAGVHSGLACGIAKDIPSAFAVMKNGPTMATTKAGTSRPVPMIVFQGDHDKTVHPRNAAAILDQQGRRGRPIETGGRTHQGVRYTTSIYLDSDGHPSLESWTIHGGGHAWAGGSSEGTYTDPNGPDASREMIRFFLEHSK